MVGDPDTGKNCLLNTIKYKKFEPLKKFKQGNYEVYSLDQKFVALSIWNTSGSEFKKKKSIWKCSSCMTKFG